MKLMAALAVSVAAQGACVPVQGGRITAADMAPAVPAFSQLPPEVELSFAPAPGATRMFTATELNHRLTRNGLDAVVTEPVCFEWPMRKLDEEELRAVMLSSLPRDSEVTIAGVTPAVAPPGRVVFPIEGLRNGAWRGHVEYESRKKFAIVARVEVRAPFARVVATEAIRAGERIEGSKLRLDTGAGEPIAADYADNLAEVTGRVARRLIRAGASIERSSLGNARAVARGDAVRVDVISGGATLRFEGIAEAAAGLGDLAPVRNPETGRIVHVRVDGSGRAQLRLSEKEN